MASSVSPSLQRTADLVCAYVTKNPIPAAELPALIARVHDSLIALDAPPAPEPAPLVPPVPIRKSVTEDAIISLEDGKPYQSLKRHLTARGLTPAAYRQKWGLPPDYPMVAPAYAARRSEAAKANGLGRHRDVA
ncbi:MucR family transcriptional regulator [Methylobacterium sp. WSM2598]|uniref:MucR family transcriptional regulator n=1 Tax=Methylobacterium sp. WSM2598 TaxID=398261 RepID=UPI000365891F|nr:MucR family transcriptional regulator [Methylobacterium sp. WSM2598]